MVDFKIGAILYYQGRYSDKRDLLLFLGLSDTNRLICFSFKKKKIVQMTPQYYDSETLWKVSDDLA